MKDKRVFDIGEFAELRPDEKWGYAIICTEPEDIYECYRHIKDAAAGTEFYDMVQNKYIEDEMEVCYEALVNQDSSHASVFFSSFEITKRLYVQIYTDIEYYDVYYDDIDWNSINVKYESLSASLVDFL